MNGKKKSERPPGLSPEENQAWDRAEKAQEQFSVDQTPPDTETKPFVAGDLDRGLAELRKERGEAEPSASPQAAPQKDYEADSRQRIADLLSRYEAASKDKEDTERRGGAWAIVQGNALGPNAGQATLNAWKSGADEGVENLDRQQRATTTATSNEDRILEIARKYRMRDPNSPISKALTEYEKAKTGFGQDVQGLSGQDVVDAGKTAVNPVYSQEQSNARTAANNQTKVEEGGRNRDVKKSEGAANRFTSEKNTKTRADATIASAALGQDSKTASGAASAGDKAGVGAITLPKTLEPLVPGDRKYTDIVPKGSTMDQQKRMREISEFSSKALDALGNLQAALRDPNSSRFERFFDTFKQSAALAAVQYKAVSLQADTKINDNGVLNPADLTLGNQAIFGLDPASFRTLLKSNPEIAAQVDNQIRAVRKTFDDNVKINHYVRGSIDEVKADAANQYRSTTQPQYAPSGELMNRVGLVPNARQPAQAPKQGSQMTEDEAARILKGL